jgi:hypothetical protein
MKKDKKHLLVPADTNEGRTPFEPELPTALIMSFVAALLMMNGNKRG